MENVRSCRIGACIDQRYLAKSPWELQQTHIWLAKRAYMDKISSKMYCGRNRSWLIMNSVEDDTKISSVKTSSCSGGWKCQGRYNNTAEAV